MQEAFELISQDFLAAWHELHVNDGLLASYVTLWLVLLWIPLTGIDRRDKICACIYALLCSAAGLTLCLALPHDPGLLHAATLSKQIQFVTVMGIVGGVRWKFLGGSSAKIIRIKKQKGAGGGKSKKNQ